MKNIILLFTLIVTPLLFGVSERDDKTEKLWEEYKRYEDAYHSFSSKSIKRDMRRRMYITLDSICKIREETQNPKRFEKRSKARAYANVVEAT